VATQCQPLASASASTMGSVCGACSRRSGSSLSKNRRASREERPGKWSLHFGASKISLQDAAAPPDIARRTVPGSGNFCLVTDTPLDAIIRHLERQGVEIADGPGERAGAAGKILSVYFHDPESSLVEISNQL